MTDIPLPNFKIRAVSANKGMRYLSPNSKKKVWDKINGIQARLDRGELRTEEAVKAEADRAYDAGQEKMRFYDKSHEDSAVQRAPRPSECLKNVLGDISGILSGTSSWPGWPFRHSSVRM